MRKSLRKSSNIINNHSWIQWIIPESDNLRILTEMDGFEGNSGVIVVAATNRSDILDNALLRPGRFVRRVTVGLPDVK